MSRQVFRGLLHAFFGIIGVAVTMTPALAALNSDLQNLNLQAASLKSQLQSVTLTSSGVCGPLVSANQSARALVNSITSIDQGLAAPLSVDASTMDALDQLSVTTLGLANEALRLSVDLNALSSVADALTLKDGITSMLQLADDIGTMADRIGEMSDKILVMSDNIGLMADRIILTQQLQNQNVTLTVQSIMQTQTNALTLVSVVESASYNVSIDTLIVNGNLLAARMAAVTFSPLTMKSQMASVATDVRSYLNQVKTLESTIKSASLSNTMTSNAETTLKLGNLSLMLTSLGTAIDGYVVAIGGLQALTSSATLSDTLKSMLQLSGDIGTMSNRILEMADVILLMSDNIGMEADQIVLTQSAMNTNVATTQRSILGVQTFAINLIKARSL